MNSTKPLPCPKCSGTHGRKSKEDGYSRFICPDCGYSCWLKHYQAEMKLK